MDRITRNDTKHGSHAKQPTEPLHDDTVIDETPAPSDTTPFLGASSRERQATSKRRKPNFITKGVNRWCNRLLGAVSERSLADQEEEYAAHRTTRDYVWNTVGVGAWGMVFPILTVVVTQLVGVEQAGMFSLAFVTGTLLMILANYGVRTYQVSVESAFPPEAQATFRNLENNGNPWGLGWQTRSKWAEGLDVPTIAEAPDAEYLYWPGCSGAFDARNRKVSAALVSLLAEAGVSFAILGNEEKCCGDAARRMGNEFVYFMLASENIATLQAYGVKKIIVQCPHCYQALARDYLQLGGHFEVIHHSELLARLVREGRLPRAREVCFHDSCYLGRYQDIYEAPREVVRAAGGSVAEMERARKTSFCCGAGGGRMWLEESAGARINEARCAQALDTDPDLVATSCPFCLTMLADGMVSADSDVPVRDIAELLAGAEK